MPSLLVSKNDNNKMPQNKEPKGRPFEVGDLKEKSFNLIRFLNDIENNGGRYSSVKRIYDSATDDFYEE